MKYKDVIKYSEEDVNFEIRKLRKNFRFLGLIMPPMGEKPVIVPIMNGGNIIAQKLMEGYTHEVIPLKVKHYSGKDELDTFSLEIPKKLFDVKRKIVFIDDVIESGLTLKVLQSIFPNSSSVVLLRKGIEYDGVFGDTVPKDAWIEFYWVDSKEKNEILGGN
ncbi:MAG: phosphoribosyltransferase [Candidatus Parvarchaeum sp.]